ncbi:hypothetical protein ZIOFF_011910 [Zingiber officinale]|uniref:Uncharacterized protein n=1 Tax=Zingiber officinale TaxID=94328 RepID=A0A8J5M020_ZINOF|nr:hypothetical protein ZIOFF_011910 [Zingiber officinale]
MVTDPTSGMIHFDIGIARKRLAASAFDMPPECRPEVEEATVRIVLAFASPNRCVALFSATSKSLQIVGGFLHQS